MSEFDTQVAEDQTPPPDDTTQAVTEPPPDDDADFEQGDDVLKIPNSNAEGGVEVFVKGSALRGARKEIKEVRRELADAKATAARAPELEQKIQQLEQTLGQYAPVVGAYQAMLQQQQQQPPPPQVDDTDAAEFAKDMDLYTADGQPDVARARRQLDRLDKRAEQKAQQYVQPLAQHTVKQQSDGLLHRAMNTVVQGVKPHPDDIRAVWSRLDPSVTATVEGARQVFVQALGLSAAAGRLQTVTDTTPTRTTQTAATRGANGQFTKADLPAPLHTEKAGGKVGAADAPLDDREKAAAKAMGITTEEYLKIAASAPGLRGRR